MTTIDALDLAINALDNERCDQYRYLRNAENDAYDKRRIARRIRELEDAIVVLKSNARHMTSNSLSLVMERAEEAAPERNATP